MGHKEKSFAGRAGCCAACNPADFTRFEQEHADDYKRFPVYLLKSRPMRDLKYLFLGLPIGMLIFILLAILLAFAAPENIPADLRPGFLNTATFAPVPLAFETRASASTATSTGKTSPPPTITFTATPSSTPSSIPFTPTATQTPTVTATLSPGQVLLLRGDLTITGPRTEAEQIRLYETSLQFTASTFSDARRLGEQINGKGYGSPTLICGPLSISILSAAGLVQSGIVPYNFWLLNPDDKSAREKLATVFPANTYDHTRIKVRIDQIDWKANPLMPGDFVYLYAGGGGNFEHMLVVNRVDSAGRAYSVTNYNAGDGFVIQEVMLYDPSDPNVGMFHEWTKRQWQKTGSTGYDGLEFWRLILQ